MSTNAVLKNDENLSEDILSEKATPAKVKAVNKLHDNMERSSFKSWNSSKTVRGPSPKKFSLSTLDKRSKFRRFGRFYKSDHSAFKHESPLKLRRSDCCDMEDKLRQPSIKDDISQLLKISASIRKDKSWAIPNTLRESNFPVIELSLSEQLSEGSWEEEPREDYFYTFGVK